MDVTDENLRVLVHVIGVMIDAEVASHAGVTALELCGRLGAAAGPVVGLSLPESDLDAVHLDVMGGASGLRSTRWNGRCGSEMFQL